MVLCSLWCFYQFRDIFFCKCWRIVFRIINGQIERSRVKVIYTEIEEQVFNGVSIEILFFGVFRVQSLGFFICKFDYYLIFFEVGEEGERFIGVCVIIVDLVLLCVGYLGKCFKYIIFFIQYFCNVGNMGFIFQMNLERERDLFKVIQKVCGGVFRFIGRVVL